MKTNKGFINRVSEYVSPEDIVFCTSSQSPPSKDLDVYCVISQGCSSIHMFYDEEGLWNEIFIDTLEDTLKKIKNTDEIAINFITELGFVYGDKKQYLKLKSLCEEKKERYTLNESKKKILKYRLKVLCSKLAEPNKENELHNSFIINSMIYPLIELLLEKHDIFPSSPKNWINQLKEVLDSEEFSDLSDIILYNDLPKLKKFTKEFMDLGRFDIEKKGNNEKTFID